MPYFNFPEKNINLLFIHIPKTGGTSLDNYFINKFNTKISKEILFFGELRKNSVSLQHITFLDFKNKKNSYNYDYNIRYDNLEILTIVRNPYYKLVSEFFFLPSIYFKRKIENDLPSKEEICSIIKNCFNEYKEEDTLNDNHFKPQHLFLLDENGEINKNIKILKTENLNEMMHDLGYVDFNVKNQISKKYNINYMDLLNEESIQLINNFYEKDFEYFGYEKK